MSWSGAAAEGADPATVEWLDWPKSIRSFTGSSVSDGCLVNGIWFSFAIECALERIERRDSERLGMRFLCTGCWPGRMGVMARICSVCLAGVAPSLSLNISILALSFGRDEGRSYMLAFNIQSKSPSPSSEPPGPALTARNNLGIHSTPS